MWPGLPVGSWVKRANELVLLQATFALIACRDGCLRLDANSGVGATALDDLTRRRERATQAKAREPAAHRHAEGLHEEAAKLRSALPTLTLPKRLGNECSTRGSCIPKRSGSKPKRAAGSCMPKP